MTFVGAQSDVDDWEAMVGEQVRALRIARNLDQTELASLANVSLSAVKNLEQGRGSSLATVIKVVRALGSESWLAGLSPRVSVSPIDVLRSRREPRQRVYRPRAN